MKKRLTWSLLAAAAALVLWGRLDSHPDAALAWARGAPLFLGGSGSSLRLVRSGLVSPELPRGPGRVRLPRPETLPELRDSLSGSVPEAASSALWSSAPSSLISARRAPDGSVHLASRHPDFSRPRGAAPGGARPRQGAVSSGRRSVPVPSGTSAAGPRGARAEPGVAVAVRPAQVERSEDRRPFAPAGPDFDGRRAGGSAARLTRPTPDAPAASWSPPPAEKKRPAPAPKPPTLADWLGKGALKPPAGRLEPPTFAPLKRLFPERLPDGRTYERSTPPPGFLEALRLPEDREPYEDWLEKDRRRGRKAEPHWHQDGAAWVFHAGKAWGLTEGGRWAWLLESDRRWWTVGDGAQRLVRHEGAWWWRTRDGWFLLKGGEPWAWRHFPAWKGHGFIHPGRGTQVVYSADGGRVAVLTPGKDTVVFDARTGELLARYPPAPRLAGEGER